MCTENYTSRPTLCNDYVLQVTVTIIHVKCRGNVVQYSTVQYSAVLYSTVQYSTVQYSTVQYSTVQYSTLHYSTVQYSTVQYSTVQYSTVQYTYNTQVNLSFFLFTQNLGIVRSDNFVSFNPRII